MENENIEQIKKKILESGVELIELDETARNNKEIMMYAVSVSWRYYRYASEELKKDRELLFAALKNSGRFYIRRLLREGVIKKNTYITSSEINQYSRTPYSYSNFELKKDRELALLAIEADKREWRNILPGFKMDKSFIIDASKKNQIYEYLSPEFKKDRDIVLVSINNQLNPIFDLLPLKLRNDREIVMAAISKNATMIQFASKTLRGDEEIMSKAVRFNEEQSISDTVLQYASSKLLLRKKFCLEMIKENGDEFVNVPNELKNDINFIIQALKKNGYILKFLSNEYKENREYVLIAVNSNGCALEFASDELRADKEIAMMAIENRASAYSYTSQKLMFDEDILNLIKMKQNVA